MLTKQQKRLFIYKTINIYERTYKLPILKNTSLKVIQKKFQEHRRLIKEGVRHYHQLWGIIKRQEEISQEEIFRESQLLIKSYIQFINFIENYQDSYQKFLLKLTDDFKKVFVQKYLEIKNLDRERKKLEIKNSQNQKILEELKLEQQENFQAFILLSNAYFLMLEKIKLLTEGLKILAEDVKNQKQIIQQVAKDFKIYQEIYEYQSKAQKIRQQIVEIAESTINFEDTLQDYLNPFQSLIDEVIKVDEDFYSTVRGIKNLADNILNSQSNLLVLKENDEISEALLDFMVSNYEKKERLKDALIKTQLLNWHQNFESIYNHPSLDEQIDSITNYISKEVTTQRKELGIVETNFVYIKPINSVEETELIKLSNDNATSKNEFTNKNHTYYTQLRDLLTRHQWKEADIETTKLMLKVMGKNDWNEVYKEDINNFSCEAFFAIDRLWVEYSHGYFGFSIQQNIWSEVGGQVDYETEKKLGDRLGWRKQGNWLDYEQLTFELSPTTPTGHLPAKWLHYNEDTFDLSPILSTDHRSTGAWRVGSWLVWQMHLFLSRAKICNETFLYIDR